MTKAEMLDVLLQIEKGSCGSVFGTGFAAAYQDSDGDLVLAVTALAKILKRIVEVIPSGFVDGVPQVEDSNEEET